MAFLGIWLREPDLNRRPSGYEPDELPDCSIPRSPFYSSETCCQRLSGKNRFAVNWLAMWIAHFEAAEALPYGRLRRFCGVFVTGSGDDERQAAGWKAVLIYSKVRFPSFLADRARGRLALSGLWRSERSSI